MFVAKGADDEARAAYDKAIELYGAGVSRVLRLKRQSLGPLEASGTDQSAAASS
jgi:predicted negative regulator of RcsB-dependent stress response